MDLDRFLNLVATVFGGMGSIYVLKAIASLSPDLIARPSSTYIGFSSPQIDSLATQKADNIVGILLVVIALFIAVLNLAFVPSGVRFVEWWMALALVAVLVGGVYISLFFVRDAIRRRQKRSVCRLIATERVNSLFKSKRLPASEVGSLLVWARTLLEMAVDDSESPRQVLQRVAEKVGLNVPDGFDFSEVDKTAR